MGSKCGVSLGNQMVSQSQASNCFVDNLCPLEMTQLQSFVLRWYHDVNIPNVWNPKGNAWRKDDTIFVHCYNEKVSGNI